MKERSYFGRSLYKFRTFYFGKHFVVFLSKRGGGCVPLLLQRLWISLKSPRLAAILIEHRRRLIFSPLPSFLPRFPSIFLKSEPRFCPNPSFQVLSKNFKTDQPRPLRPWALLDVESYSRTALTFCNDSSQFDLNCAKEQLCLSSLFWPNALEDHPSHLITFESLTVAKRAQN